MAVTEYMVIGGMQDRAASPATSKRKVAKGKGEKAKAEVEEQIFHGQFFRVEAESNAEAVQAVRNMFPGATNDKMFVVKQSSGEEL